MAIVLISTKTLATLIWVFCVGSGSGNISNLLASGKPPRQLAWDGAVESPRLRGQGEPGEQES